MVKKCTTKRPSVKNGLFVVINWAFERPIGQILLRYFIPEKYNFLAESYKIINLMPKVIQNWGQKRGHSLNCLKALCLLSFPLFLHQHKGNPVPTRKRHWGQENPCK